MKNLYNLILVGLLIGCCFSQQIRLTQSHHTFGQGKILINTKEDFQPLWRKNIQKQFSRYKKAFKEEDNLPQKISNIKQNKNILDCTFPLILIDGICQCPRNLKNSRGECIGFRINQPKQKQRSGEKTQTIISKTVQDQCFQLKININKKTGNIQDLAFIKRTYDGSNNNQKIKDWGSSGSLMPRAVRANYVDDISKPIQYLPSPRIISNIIGVQSNPVKRNPSRVTIAFVIFGQFIGHDLTFTKSQPITGQQMNIPIPSNDLFFKNQSFINFRRSQFAQNFKKPRMHRNSVTAWIDGSQIYGSDSQTACSLRSFQNGKLKISIQGNQGNFLPLQNGTFKAGDVRALENAILTTFHTIFIRQHNRKCDQILLKNPLFNDETIFQIARNYVIGLLQKIVIKDYLKILLGDSYDSIVGQYDGYNQNINPSISNQFSTSVNRFGHSLLYNKIPTINNKDKIQKQYRLYELFSQQNLINSKFIAQILRGASRTIAKEKNVQFVDDIRNFLILNPNNRQIKLDLLSLNIQRARDHGMPTYNDVRQAYGLQRIKRFSDLVPRRQKGFADKLKQAYKSPDNIQLYVGILAQKPLKGAVVGELGAQIIGRTFRDLRDGDRFWYENIYPQSIIDEIQNTELGDICVRNSFAKNLPSNIFTYSRN